MDLNPNTPLTVTLTMGKLYAAIGALGAAAIALLVGFWLVGTWTVGGVRDDVKNIRDDISGLHKSDKDNVARIADVSTKLSDQIQGLRTDFGNLHTDFTSLGAQFKYFSENLIPSTSRLLDWIIASINSTHVSHLYRLLGPIQNN